MKFSIIIPSFNQPDFIAETLENVTSLKEEAAKRNIPVEIILFDACSGPEVQAIIDKYRPMLDLVRVEKDDGQYDAINKGIQASTGDYWTWLNTDDTLDKEGFFRLARLLEMDPLIDYVYGDIEHIDEKSKSIRYVPSYYFDLDLLVKQVPGIFQQGSFFRKSFTDKLGLLKPYRCSFDYEYVLRVLKNKGRVYWADFKVANFRLHNASKTGSMTPVFIREQLLISKDYGRKWFHFLSWFSHLRLIKHKILPRK